MSNDKDRDKTVLALTAMCILVAADLRLMEASGAIDLERWPNAKRLVDAVNGQPDA